VARPLSEVWLAELGARLEAINVGEKGDGRLALGQEVTGTPKGTVSYTVLLGDGAPAALVAGSTSGADVVLIEDYETATKLLEGAPVMRLLGEGAIKLRGDVAALLGRDRELAAVSGALRSDP
jgi:hypothetical protein